MKCPKYLRIFLALCEFSFKALGLGILGVFAAALLPYLGTLALACLPFLAVIGAAVMLIRKLLK